jgi:hypothetical protein
LAQSASVVRNGSLAIASDPATILGLRRGLLIDKAARISNGAKVAEVLDHPLTSLDRRAESARSRLEVFGKKNSPKKFLGPTAILRLLFLRSPSVSRPVSHSPVAIFSLGGSGGRSSP